MNPSEQIEETTTANMHSVDQSSSYRLAIHLNNVGVSLLQRRAYKQAHDTLKDAVSVIRFTFAEPEEQQSARTEAMLSKAAHRLASPKSLATTASSQLVTISDHSGIASSVGALNNHPSDKTVYAIEIEHFSCIEDRDVDVDSAILLHNFALAHLLCARSGPNSRRTLAAAQKVAALAYRTLSTRLAVSEQHDFEELVVLKPKLILVAVSVLNSMVQILREANQGARARQSFQRLSALKAAIQGVPPEAAAAESHVAAAA